MGIPKFYRWLTQRYPLIVHQVRKEDDVPPIDNLYLDLNGMVHNVLHGNSTEKHILASHMINSGNIDEVWCELFRAMDDVIHLINPRKLLFIALDSSTPVAKMTQQRSRRIKGIKALQSLDELAKHHTEDELFDVNAISPGTEFMDDLNRQIDFFLQSKINEDPLYQKIKIVFSDSNVPGEGEHKIMEYLRCYKKSPEYTPNTRHCVYGLDADLIMLGLVSHEPHMMIIREQQQGGRSSREGTVISIARQTIMTMQGYEILYVSILREYFDAEFRSLEPLLSFKYDLERIIDDFVFFSFFVGNDFLPYLNTVDINYGSLDMIMRIYKNLLPKLKDYITNNSKIIWANAELIFAELGKSELQVMKDRLEEGTVAETKGKGRGKLRPKKQQSPPVSSPSDPEKEEIKGKSSPAPSPVEKGLEEDKEGKVEGEIEMEEEENIIPPEVAKVLNPKIEMDNQFMKKICSVYAEDAEKAKKLYYAEKLHFDISTEAGKKQFAELSRKYLEGLQWVMYYYYKGVQHWGWYYPYHYAPLISDVKSVYAYVPKENEKEFDLKEPNHPLTPFQQLLCILPASSAKLLPKHYEALYDSYSEIADLYPISYELDFNGKINPWEAIKLIPFVDVCRVIEAEKHLYEKTKATLTSSEMNRNSFHLPTEYGYTATPATLNVISTLKDMPMLINPTCWKKDYVFPLKPETAMFSAILPPGVELPCYDFPSLKFLPIIGSKIVLADKRDCEYDRMIVILEDNKIEASKCQELLGKTVFVDYPNQKEARIVQVLTKTHCIGNTFNPLTKIVEIACTEGNTQNEFEYAKYELTRRGLQCGTTGEISFTVACQTVEYINKNFMGSDFYSKGFSYKPFLYASPVIMMSRDPRNCFNCDKWIANQELQFPLQAPISIVRGKDFGAIGVVTGNSEKNKIQVLIKEQVNKKVIDEIYTMQNSPGKGEGKKYEQFTMLRDVAKKLKTTLYTLKRILGSVKIKVAERSDIIYNVGLALKNSMTKVNIPYHLGYNYANREQTLSEEVIKSIEEYMKKYPVLFQVLEASEMNQTYSALLASVVFPADLHPEESLKSLFKWVQSLPISKLPFVPFGARVIQPLQYKQIKDKITMESDARPASLSDVRDPKDIQIERYPFWIRPFGPKSIKELEVGDRVINIKTSGSAFVPFGCHGTVLGIEGRKVFVEFDRQLITGNTFGGQCGKYQGMIVDGYSLLDLFVY